MCGIILGVLFALIASIILANIVMYGTHFIRVNYGDRQDETDEEKQEIDDTERQVYAWTVVGVLVVMFINWGATRARMSKMPSYGVAVMTPHGVPVMTPQSGSVVTYETYSDDSSLGSYGSSGGWRSPRSSLFSSGGAVATQSMTRSDLDRLLAREGQVQILFSNVPSVTPL
jgi:uncharacterized membrane protein YgcG